MNDAAREELEKIRQKNGGFLRPRDVVKFAKNKTSALHEYFDWDNSSAAEKWRIRQAQEIIRVVVYTNEETSENVRAFVSLKTDRYQHKGYRAIAEVMDDAQLMAQMIIDAKQELETFTSKYKALRKVAQLSGIFDKIEEFISKGGDRLSA